MAAQILYTPDSTLESDWQRIAGFSMIVAPLLSLIGFLFHPQNVGEGAEELRAIATQSTNWSIAHILFLFSMVFFILSASGMMQMLHPRRRWLSMIAMLLMVLGAVFFSAMFGTELTVNAIATLPPTQFAGLAAAMEAIAAGNGPLPIFILGVTLNLGLILFAIGLFLEQCVPRWAAVALAAGSLILLSAVVTDAYGALSSGIMLVGLAPIGLQLLTDPR